MDNGLLRTLSIKLTSNSEVDVVDGFRKIAVFNGQTVKDELLDWMRDYTRSNSPKFEIVTEKELMDHAKKNGYPTTQGTIKKYRRRGLLQDESGAWFFTNPVGSVVYRLDKMDRFLRDRKERPYSRLEDNQNDQDR